MDPAAHWQGVFSTNEDEGLSWTQREPVVSLRLLERAGAGPESRVADVGCGARGLVNALAPRGWRRLVGVDLAPAALSRAQAALGPALAARVEWVAQDVRALRLAEPVDVWHDRAVLHFLTEPEARAAYAGAVRRNLRVGGHAVVGTFAPEGPERCSGLPVARADEADVHRTLGEDAFELVHAERETHETPWGAPQRFSWALLRRVR